MLSAIYRVLSAIYRVLSAIYRVLSAIYRVLSAIYIVLSAIYRVLSAIYRVLSAIQSALQLPREHSYLIELSDNQVPSSGTLLSNRAVRESWTLQWAHSWLTKLQYVHRLNGDISGSFMSDNHRTRRKHCNGHILGS